MNGAEIKNRPLYKVLNYWKDVYGLGLTPHFLVHITGVPWHELVKELRNPYPDGRYRMLRCPDVGAYVLYVDSTLDEISDWSQSCTSKFTDPAFDKIENQIEDYPPQDGYVCTRNNVGLKNIPFRPEATHKKYKIYGTVSDEKIVDDMRSVWQNAVQALEK